MNCLSLWERFAGSLPSTSQVSLIISSVSRLALLSPLRVLRCCIQVLSPGSETCLSSLTLCQPCSIKVNSTPYICMLEPKGLGKNNKKSHWRVPFTATFSKTRKIGALWIERDDDYDAVDPVSLLKEEARQVVVNSKRAMPQVFWWGGELASYCQQRAEGAYGGSQLVNQAWRSLSVFL